MRPWRGIAATRAAERPNLLVCTSTRKYFMFNTGEVVVFIR